MRKIIRLRNFVIALLVLLFGIFSILYFTSNIKASALKYDLEEFDETGLIDANDPKVSLEEEILVKENERFKMYFDETTTIVTIYDKLYDKYYQTADKENSNNLYKSPFTIEYFDKDSVSGGVLRMNGFDNSILFYDVLTGIYSRHYQFKYTEDGVQILYDIGKFGITSDFFPQRITEERFNQLFRNNPLLPRDLRIRVSAFYTQITTTDESGNSQRYYYVDNINKIMSGYLYDALYINGFQPYDEYGEPIWELDEDGEPLLDENGDKIPAREIYSQELAAAHNAEANYSTDISQPRFQFVISYRLTETGLESKILRNTIKEAEQTGSNHFLATIDFLPNFTQVDQSKTEKGMIVVPDGSGAVINFNNQKSRYRTYNKAIYGNDMSVYPDEKRPSEERLMFPMYGFIDQTNQQGVLAIVEQGAAQSRIVADIPRDLVPYNKAYFKTSFRMSQEVSVGTGYYVQKFIKWSRTIPQVDYTYRFDFLSPDELNYSALANKYRNYLIERYGLTEKDQTKNVLVNVNVLGAFERYNSFLGFRYKEKAALTTFAQAKDILSELQELGVGNLNLLYTSWTHDAFETELRKNNKISKVLGGQKELNKLMGYLDENGIGFYPEVSIGTAKGYSQLFGKMRFTARSISSSYAEHFPYHLSTNVPEKTLSATYYISPNFYNSIANDVSRNLNRFKINGAMVNDLGNYKIANYSRSNSVSLIDGIRFQEEALAKLTSNIDQTILKAPYDYGFKYANVVIDAPITSSSYGIFDYAIPFYQLVASGIFDYASKSINGNYQNKDWFFLKAIETGTNLLYDLSYENPKILLETDYNMYFYTYYQNWTYEISELAKMIDELRIHEGRLVEHEQIANNVALVKYSNGVEIVINTSLTDVFYDGYLISANSYRKIKG